MFEELKNIILSGESYPIKCDLVVLEKIQEEFGSISEFESLLIPWEPKLDEEGKEVRGKEGKTLFQARFPSIKAVNSALYLMVKEGEEIIAECENRAPKVLSRNQIARRCDLTPLDIADQLHDEFLRCLRVKNGETTQNQTEETKKSSS
ncbi:MAG: hypothetical protein K1W34_14185 [Lachnospiraceae bacterium]